MPFLKIIIFGVGSAILFILYRHDRNLAKEENLRFSRMPWIYTAACVIILLLEGLSNKPPLITQEPTIVTKPSSPMPSTAENAVVKSNTIPANNPPQRMPENIPAKPKANYYWQLNMGSLDAERTNDMARQATEDEQTSRQQMEARINDWKKYRQGHISAYLDEQQRRNDYTNHINQEIENDITVFECAIWGLGQLLPKQAATYGLTNNSDFNQQVISIFYSKLLTVGPLQDHFLTDTNFISVGTNLEWHFNISIVLNSRDVEGQLPFPEPTLRIWPTSGDSMIKIEDDSLDPSRPSLTISLVDGSNSFRVNAGTNSDDIIFKALSSLIKSQNGKLPINK